LIILIIVIRLFTVLSDVYKVTSIVLGNEAQERFLIAYQRVDQ